MALYTFFSVLDKSSMFKVSTGYVKPLHIIWSKCPDKWDRKNTIHIDDLDRNFLLNLKSGLVKVKIHMVASLYTYHFDRFIVACVCISTSQQNHRPSKYF